MNAIKKVLGAIFYWTYDRGSWQWDLSCLVFIIIIFATPQDYFDRFTNNPLTSDQIRSAVATFLKNFL
jgi:hypothetical protein